MIYNHKVEPYKYSQGVPFTGKEKFYCYWICNDWIAQGSQIVWGTDVQNQNWACDEFNLNLRSL